MKITSTILFLISSILFFSCATREQSQPEQVVTHQLPQKEKGDESETQLDPSLQVETNEVRTEKEDVFLSLIGEWVVENVECDHKQAKKTEIISDLYLQPKEMTFTFSRDVTGVENGELTVISIDDVKVCQLTLPFIIETVLTHHNTNTLLIRSTAPPTFLPVGCNQPTLANTARNKAGNLYDRLLPYARFFGLVDPISVVSRYVDPLMYLLGSTAQTREVIFGHPEIPEPLLTHFLPRLAEFEVLEETEKLNLRINNYFGCQKRTRKNPLQPHNALMILSKEPPPVANCLSETLELRPELRSVQRRN